MIQQSPQPVLPSAEPGARTTARYRSVDALRGLIMMLMAIDHASGFIARQHASEFWAGAMSAYTSAFPFLTRLVTHLCAPGFFFLMGAGIDWFAAGHRQAGYSEASARRRVAWRGFILLLTAQFFELPVLFVQTLFAPAKVSLNTITAPPPNDGSALFYALITLSGLGLVMMACSLLLRLRPWAWLLVSAICVVITNSFLPASGKPGPWWETILLTPGISQHLLVLYPVIPWLAASAAGMYFGWWWRTDPLRAARRVWIPGVVLVLTGLMLRAAGGWGNIRLPRDTGWIEFLNNVKYPPSLVYLCLFIGINLLLLAALTRLPEVLKSDRSPLIVFGQTPLFFYILHFYVFAACAHLFFGEASSLEGMYLVWLAVLAFLYPICLWYRSFKMGKPRESIWRLF